MTDTSTFRLLRVFLCHSSADKPAVRELYRRLDADGIDAWLDEENLLPGQDWQLEIPKAVRAADVVIVCLSRGSINIAGYVQKEIKFALDVADEQPEGTIFLIPLKLEECKVPERLTRWQWVDLFSPNGYERLMRALQVRVTGLGLRPSPIQTAATPALQSEADAVTAQSISNVSGGITVDAENVNVGQDMVGHDKIIRANTYIENATIIQSAPSMSSPIPEEEDAILQLANLPSPEGTLAAKLRQFGDIDFMPVSAGKFLMGSQDDNRFVEHVQETPQHVVEISYDYWIARYLVTNDQFAAFARETQYTTTAERDGSWILDQSQPNAILGIDWSHPFGPKSDLRKRGQYPAVHVSWYDARAYCRWLNERLQGELDEMTVRLPTEAEWEKAARGDYGNEWPWGNEFDRDKCNSKEGRRGSTTPVGMYSSRGDSPYGVADMVGNVWEWCHSQIKPYPYKSNDGREREPGVGRLVLRGGSFYDEQRFARCAFRYYQGPVARSFNIGFRMVIAPALS